MLHKGKEGLLVFPPGHQGYLPQVAMVTSKAHDVTHYGPVLPESSSQTLSPKREFHLEYVVAGAGVTVSP